MRKCLRNVDLACCRIRHSKELLQGLVLKTHVACSSNDNKSDAQTRTTAQ